MGFWRLEGHDHHRVPLIIVLTMGVNIQSLVTIIMIAWHMPAYGRQHGIMIMNDHHDYNGYDNDHDDYYNYNAYCACHRSEHSESRSS